MRALGRELRKVLESVALRIDDIGSTAVRGLAAKPIIDVQISVAWFVPLSAFRDPIESCGFVWRPKNEELTLAHLVLKGRQAYVDAKAPFVWATIARAHAWAQRTGWQPGPSDA